MSPGTESLILEGVEVLWPNFRGLKTLYNDAGSRIFHIVIDDLDLAEKLFADGWNLKPLKNEDGEVDAYHLQVKINFDSYRPPQIFKIRPGKEPLLLDESAMGMCDILPIDFVDIEINPYAWSVRGETGIKAYLSSMFITFKENRLYDKYLDIGP